MTERISFESAQKKALDIARTRLVLGGALMLAAFLVVIVKLVGITAFSESGETFTASARNVVSETKMGRADIFDRNGYLLATTLITHSLFANPSDITNLESTAESLANIFPSLSKTSITKTLSKTHNDGKKKKFVWLKRHITPNQAYRVNRLGVPGLDFKKQERRIYPHSNLTAHVIGFTDTDNKGLAGLERQFNVHLSTTKKPLHLSIDIRVQQILKQELSSQINKFKAIGGTGLMLDVNSGEILALVSLPDFDPNASNKASDNEKMNRATMEVHELGSVFKIFNHAIALETGVAKMDSHYDARKPIYIAGHKIDDYHAKYRWLTVPEVFIFSSNIGSAKMALDIGHETQRKFFRNLGLLRKSDVELAEVGRPLYPNPWNKLSSMTVAFGHGISVSSLHAASAVASIINGGNLLPATLIQSDKTQLTGEKVISEKTSEAMRKLLRMVVKNGTGRNAEAPGYMVGGKTGTADKVVDGIYSKTDVVSSFIGVFPMNSPRYLVLVQLDEPKGIKESHYYRTGGWTAAPVVGQVISKVAPLLGIPPIETKSNSIINVSSPSTERQKITMN
jgi:cell division protein FtsI (penicillin-binding protein 3)